MGGLYQVSCGDMVVRRVLLRVFSATASSAVLLMPAGAQDRPGFQAIQLPPVTIAPDAMPPKRIARQKPAQNRGTRSRTVVLSNQPQPASAGASGVRAASSDGVGALQPTAASAVRF